MVTHDYIAELIAPVSLSTFFESYWDKKHIYIKKEDGKNLHQLFSYERLSEIVNTQIYNLRPHDLRITTAGNILDTEEFTEVSSHYVSAVTQPREKISISKLNEYLQNGASVVISEIHETDKVLQQFAHQLKGDFGVPVSVTVVHSSKANETFKPHYDTTDLFILQIDGQKLWKLGGYTAHPTKFRDETNYTETIDTDAEDVILSPGDVLYIPSGAWHDTASVTDTSLSLSISVHNKRNIDLAYTIIHYYLSQNLLNDKVLRANMPLENIVGKEQHQRQCREVFNTIKEDIESLLQEFDGKDLEDLLNLVNQSNLMNRGFSSSFEQKVKFPKK